MAREPLLTPSEFPAAVQGHHIFIGLHTLRFWFCHHFGSDDQQQHTGYVPYVCIFGVPMDSEEEVDSECKDGAFWDESCFSGFLASGFYFLVSNLILASSSKRCCPQSS